jgi:DNA polymerase-3 subunit delta
VKVDIHQLDAHLARALQAGQLAPCYVVMSDEPLLSIEASDAIRAAALKSGVSSREVFTLERGARLQELLSCFSSGSLFGDRVLAEIRIPGGKPAKDQIDALLQIATWLKSGQTDAMALVTLPKLTTKAMDAEWFTALTKAGSLINAPVVDAHSLPRWIEERLAAKGLSLQKGCSQWLAERVEGNLIAAKQEIDKLALLADGQSVSMELLQGSVANVARYNVFDLGLELLNGKAEHLIRMLDGLQAEGEAPTLVLWAIGEEIKNLQTIRQSMGKGQSASVAVKQLRVWGAKVDASAKAATRLSAQRLNSLSERLAHADKAVKGLVREDPWHVLRTLALDLAGHPTPSALETT